SDVCSSDLLLAGWLLLQGQRQRAMPALAGFAAMMALWCAGHIAIVQQQHSVGVALVLANPLMPTFFLHFALQFVASTAEVLPRWRRLLPALYGLSLLVIA